MKKCEPKSVRNKNHEKLIEIVTTLLEIEDGSVTDETSPETVDQWDSLNHVNMCMAVCEEFGVSMTTEDMASIRRVGDIVELLKARGVDCG